MDITFLCRLQTTVYLIRCNLKGVYAIHWALYLASCYPVLLQLQITVVLLPVGPQIFISLFQFLAALWLRAPCRHQMFAVHRRHRWIFPNTPRPSSHSACGQRGQGRPSRLWSLPRERICCCVGTSLTRNNFDFIFSRKLLFLLDNYIDSL